MTSTYPIPRLIVNTKRICKRKRGCYIMSVIAKYNKGSQFDIDTEGFKFYKLSKIYNKKKPDMVYWIKGLQVFNTKYGDSAVAILDDKFVNLPSHMIGTVKDMLDDDKVVEAIKEDKIGFTIRTYEDSKHGKGTCYGVQWVEDDKHDDELPF